jgi:hypothetical protein
MACQPNVFSVFASNRPRAHYVLAMRRQAATVPLPYRPTSLNNTSRVDKQILLRAEPLTLSLGRGYRCMSTRHYAIRPFATNYRSRRLSLQKDLPVSVVCVRARIPSLSRSTREPHSELPRLPSSSSAHLECGISPCTNSLYLLFRQIRFSMGRALKTGHVTHRGSVCSFQW